MCAVTLKLALVQILSVVTTVLEKIEILQNKGLKEFMGGNFEVDNVSHTFVGM